jgi:hypothetical protein
MDFGASRLSVSPGSEALSEVDFGSALHPANGTVRNATAQSSIHHLTLLLRFIIGYASSWLLRPLCSDVNIGISSQRFEKALDFQGESE